MSHTSPKLRLWGKLQAFSTVLQSLHTSAAMATSGHGPPCPCLPTHIPAQNFFFFSLLCWNGKQHFCGACNFLPKHPRKALRIWGSSRWSSSGNKLFFCCTTSYHVPHIALLSGSVFLGFFSLQSSSTRAGNVVLGNNTNAMEDLVQKCCQARSSRSKLHHCPKISKGSCLLP